MGNNKNKNETEDSFSKFLEFITDRKDVYKYLHNTETQETADKILKEGFDFESHLDHTTDIVTGIDMIELKYFLIKRRRYGSYTIVIEIGKSIVDYYSRQLINTEYHFSEVLTTTEPTISDNDEPLYRLHKRFIKGYYDHNMNKCIENKYFDPFFHTKQFDNNLTKLIES